MADRDLSVEVEELVRPVADVLDVELLEVEVKGHRNRRVVRLVADAVDGLDVDGIAALSRRVGDELDARDLVPGAYTLEVTSPGVDRPLRTARDFRRNVGREVRIVRSRHAAAAPGVKGQVTGTVAAADDEAVTLTVDGQELAVDLDEIDHGKVVLPW